MCFEKYLDKCCADLKIKFNHKASLKYSEFNYTKINTQQNIDIDGKMIVEANAISAQYITYKYLIVKVVIKPFIRGCYAMRGI